MQTVYAHHAEQLCGSVTMRPRRAIGIFRPVFVMNCVLPAPFSSFPADEQTSSSSGSNGSRTPSPQQSGSSGYSSACSPPSFSPPPETYSRKVFVGGLPPDIDQGETCPQFYYKNSAALICLRCMISFKVYKLSN